MPQEAEVIAVKYEGKRMQDMTEDERDLTATAILAAISIITGWTLPANEVYLDTLDKQFAKKLSERYKNVTQAEFEYAFRNKPLDVKDWGKPINLAMIDEVMMPYLDERYDLSMQEEKISKKLPESTTPQLMSDEDWQQWLDDIATYEVNKIPCDSYHYLERTGKIVLSKQEKWDYIQRAIVHVASLLDPLSKEGLEFARMREKEEFDPVTSSTLITTSKRLAVFDHFSKKKQDE